jgi:type I restriction enzyme S subunit
MKLSAYPRYKPSGVEWLGDVPEHWEVKRGRFAMRINPSAPRLRALKPEDEISFVPMDAVGVGGGLNLEQSRILADVSGGYTEFQDGDVVVAKITPCFENGKAALAHGLLNGAAYGTTELHVLRTGPSLDRSFLFYVAISDMFRKLGESEMYGASGQKRVPPEFNKDFRTPLPSLAEQQAIATFLDRVTGRVDRLVAKKRELIERLKEKRTALISRTVTRGLPAEAAAKAGLPVNPPLKPSALGWLGDIPAHWSVTRLKHAVSRIVDCPHETPVYSEDGEFAVIRTADMIQGTLRLENVYRVDAEEYRRRIRREPVYEGDVLYGREGERWGFAATVPASPVVCLGQRMMQFRAAAHHSNRFLMWQLNSRSTYEQGVVEKMGSTAPHVNVETIRNYWLTDPPLSEQSAISAYLDEETAKLDALIKKVEEAVERLQEYRTALITAAITGKIDVREAQKP